MVLCHILPGRVSLSTGMVTEASCKSFTIPTGCTRFQELHDIIMSVCMSARTRKNRPISIASHITVTPAWLGRIMQSLRNTFIAGFCIQNRLQWSHGQSLFYITPIVFLQSRNRSITISFFLTITPVSLHGAPAALPGLQSR